nr:hypothetical protein 35 [Balneolaceae bacterium]
MKTESAEDTYKPITYSGKCIIELGKDNGLKSQIANDLKNECQAHTQHTLQALLEEDLEQLFMNKFDCYNGIEGDGQEFPAMTKDKFVEVVSTLIKQHMGAPGETD